MAATLKNKRLKKYIHDNTETKIRSRANDCPVISLNFNPDGNSVEAVVNGSSGIKYDVTFSGLLQDPIKSNCTCPFDHGNVCKHEVALANEIEAYFSEKSLILDSEIPNTIPKTTKIKYSTTAPIVIDFPDDYVMDNVIRKNATATVFRESNYTNTHLKAVSVKENHINLQVAGNYWGDYHDVQIQKKGTQLTLSCNCRATNKALCKHQARSLDYIDKAIPLAFASQEKIIAQKDELLQQFGFTINNPIYKNYFTFDYIDGNLSVIPIKNGILRLSKYEDYTSFKKDFLSDKNIIEDQLPFFEKKPKKIKEKGFGIIFSFPPEEDEDIDLITVVPITGNSNKEQTDLVSKIENITPEYFLLNKKNYTKENEVAIIEKLILLNSDEYNFKEGEREKFYFEHLRGVVNLIDDSTLTYRIEDSYDDYYKLGRKDLKVITIGKEIPKLFFKVKEETHFYTLKAYFEIAGKKKQLVKNKSVNNLLFIQDKDTYYLYKSFYDAKAFAYFGQEPELRINKEDFEGYYQEFIKPLSDRYQVTITHKKRKEKKVEASLFKKQIYLSEIEENIIIKPVIEYNEKHIEVLAPSIIEEVEEDITYRIKRDHALEEQFINTLQNLHPTFQDQTQTFFYINKEDFVADMWFLNAFDQLEQQGIEVFGFDSLSKMKYNRHKPSIAVATNSGIDWFDVSIQISFGNQEVSLKDIRKSIVNKNNYVQLKDGTIGILPQEWVEKYSHAFRAGDVKKDSIQISKYQLSVIDSLYDTLDATSEMATNHLEIKKRLNSFKEISNVTQPKGLKATLRDYQKEGLNWLNFLDEYNFGGCLADDMGLGKTLQIISFLKHLKNTKKPKNASLIVLPTSLIFNWQEEIKKFCPTLSFAIHTGSDREKTTANFSAVNIVFSTYGVVMRDVSFLKEYQFNYIILDESQAIKNPNSQRFKSVRLLQANNKLVLTGTPIENNTFDLYAQMTFVNPGLLGTMANFKKEFSTPIDKNKDKDVANDLRQLINPFMIRRTKEQVATELPEKTEQVLYCTMEAEQQKLYDAYKNKYRNYLLNKIDENGIGKSKMYVLEGLTKLRQICDAPQLLNDDETYTSESIKIQELLGHITEKTGSHKILIFSQFVKMLLLIKVALDKENITYEYLDGKTKDRQSKVGNFQENKDVRVFLISLKAGGTGLNLTAADYVYLVDPWWNPAVEAQAIDRCYRIGQTKKVMAYKMICKGTVEEKIINYQIGKKQLSNDIIQTDENFVKNLSKESITELFS